MGLSWYVCSIVVDIALAIATISVVSASTCSYTWHPYANPFSIFSVVLSRYSIATSSSSLNETEEDIAGDLQLVLAIGAEEEAVVDDISEVLIEANEVILEIVVG